MAAAAGTTVRAAQYVRMSTERQDFSVEFQTAVNTAYAIARGYELVRTYADEGVSGLGIEKRQGLKQLLADVISGEAGFAVILVYDVSRWGRFQNPDQAAHYEYICNEAGVTIEYCAEPFSNDGSIAGILLKHMKRAMAAEYSRELSEKIKHAQARLAAAGYWQGGPAGYGLRRQVVTRTGRVLGTREFGEYKAVQGARTILVPGPKEEIATVRWIYRLFVHEGRTLAAIARGLNEQAIMSETGRPWTAPQVRQVLSSEKYVSCLVHGRRLTTLGAGRWVSDPSEWRRTRTAYKPLIAPAMFRAAQAERARRRQPISNDQLLDELRLLLREHGELSETLLARHGRHCRSLYRLRFGSTLAAFVRAGHQLTAAQLRMAAQARAIVEQRRRTGEYLPSAQLLASLADLLARKGRLTKMIIAADAATPHPELYRSRFGGMRRAYALVGYRPTPYQEKRMEMVGGQTIAQEEAGLLAKRDEPMSERYVVRPDSEGYSVIDLWTGAPAMIAMTPQTGIAEDDARHTAELLNRRTGNGDHGPS